MIFSFDYQRDEMISVIAEPGVWYNAQAKMNIVSVIHPF